MPLARCGTLELLTHATRPGTLIALPRASAASAALGLAGPKATISVVCPGTFPTTAAYAA
jgi:hypothetical protein